MPHDATASQPSDRVQHITAELAELAERDDPAARPRVIELHDELTRIATATGLSYPPPLPPYGQPGPVTAAQEARWASQCKPERASWDLWGNATESVRTAQDLLDRWRVAESKLA